jgi:hypothetical protein
VGILHARFDTSLAHTTKKRFKKAD